MIPILPLICLAYFILYALAARIPSKPQEPLIPYSNTLRPVQTELGPQDSFEAWLSHEEKVAWRRLLHNVAPSAVNMHDAAPGTVIASPSKKNPNYYFHWIRDSAIVTSHLVSLFYSAPTSPTSTNILLPFLEFYTNLTYRLQHTTNPSGSFHPFLHSLGEPKFHVSGAPFTSSWGRPQNDGPALRALTLMSYLRAYNASHPDLWATKRPGWNPYADLYAAELPANSVIKADLEFVARYWSSPGGFDLWEEVRGQHFFTWMVQLRALREGADVAGRFEDWGAARWYAAQANSLEVSLQEKFWSEEKGHMVATMGSGRSGLDCGVLLGALHGTARGHEGSPFPPHRDEVLVTLLRFVEDQGERFPINAPPADADPMHFRPVGLGRYPEDVYDGVGTSSRGGNPWFLCTASAAEVLYRTAGHFITKPIPITSRSHAFWSALLPQSHLTAGESLNPGTTAHTEALAALKGAGDGFLAVVRKHVDAEGSMSEQFDRETGYERGARDLSWSYASFLGAVAARDGG